MKRTVSVLLCICFCFAFTACDFGSVSEVSNSVSAETLSAANSDMSGDDEIGNNSDNAAESADNADSTDCDESIGEVETKILIAYFSCTGTTKAVSEFLFGRLNADIFEIVPEIPYTADDLNYTNSSARATAEQNNASARPSISNTVQNMSTYDVIFIGYPIWHGQAPKIIYTFLESYDFSGKTIIPFCTSHSSGIGQSDTNLHGLCNENVTWIQGKRFGTVLSEDEIMQWIGGIDFQS